MNDKSKSTAGRVLSELYREDQRQRQEPPQSAPERSEPDRGHDDDPRGRDAA